MMRMLRKEDEADWKRLLKQLNEEKEPLLSIEELIDDPNFFGIIVEDKEDRRSIGFGSISFYQSSLAGRTGRIEDVVVDKNERGKGIGRILFQQLKREARYRNANSVQLTSNPNRIVARKLYESEGFVLRDTGLFTLETKKDPRMARIGDVLGLYIRGCSDRHFFEDQINWQQVLVPKGATLHFTDGFKIREYYQNYSTYNTPLEQFWTVVLDEQDGKWGIVLPEGDYIVGSPGEEEDDQSGREDRQAHVSRVFYTFDVLRYFSLAEVKALPAS